MKNEFSEDDLSHGVVTLVNHYVPSSDDKKKYQCADVVNHIIEFETSLISTLTRVLDSIEIAEKNGHSSTELSLLKTFTKTYSSWVCGVNKDVEKKQQELIERVLSARGVSLDQASKFDVMGFEFTATADSSKINYIVSDLFSYSDVANFNMPLTDVVVTGKNKLRKGQLPSLLIVDLWPNYVDSPNEDNENK